MVECLSCGDRLEAVLPQSTPHTGNCRNCGNFVVFTSNSKIVSQAIKDQKQQFKPHFDLFKSLKSQSRPVSQGGYSVITGKYNSNAKYLRYRKQNIKQLFQISERFGFKASTVHMAVAIYDHFLQVDSMIDRLRGSYKSCYNVVSEQISTFIASVALFVASKYSEIKYPVVQDVCTLMGCPFTFEEFIEMERVILEMFEFNLQLPTIHDIMSTLLSQGIVFTTDSVVVEKDPSLRSTENPLDTHSIVPVTKFDPSKLARVVSKAKQLCEFLPNILIYDSDLIVATNPLHLTFAVVLEARQRSKLTPIWPEELDFMIFGTTVDREAKK